MGYKEKFFMTYSSFNSFSILAKAYFLPYLKLSFKVKQQVHYKQTYNARTIHIIGFIFSNLNVSVPKHGKVLTGSGACWSLYDCCQKENC